jgi:toxin YoeB
MGSVLKIMNYSLELSKRAIKEFKIWKRSNDRITQKKIDKIIEELKIHPQKGIGKPEQLKNELTGYWYRRINKKDRLVYKILEDKVLVFILSARGHYRDR